MNKPVYSFMFVSRNKDNKDVPNFKPRSKNFLSTKDPSDLKADFKAFVENGVEGETARFYMSVNSRNMEKTKTALICKLVADDTVNLTKIEQITVSLANLPQNASTKKWLFDFDNDSTEDMKQFLLDVTLESKDEKIISSCTPTPHGFAIVTAHGFDTRALMKKWSWCCDLKRDDMLFLSADVNN